MRLTEAQLAEYQERQRRRGFALPLSDDPIDCTEEPERALQAVIETWCEQSGFPFFHDRSRGKNEPGFPDLVIALLGGRTLWIELKSKGGKMRKEQEQWRLRLMHLGHEHHVIRNFKRFLEVVNGN